MLAELGPDPAHLSGRVRQLGHHVLHGEVAELRVRQGHDRLAGGEVGVGQHVGSGVDLAVGHAVAVEQVLELGRGQALGPLGDQLVELGLVRAPGVVGGVALVLGQLRTAHRLGQPLEHRVLVAADQVLAVRGRIGVGRRHVGQDRPGAGPDVTADRVLGDQRLHHAEHRLVERRVDHLTPTGVLPGVQRDQRADAGEGGRQRVADRDAGARRRPVRLADHRPQPAHRLADRAVARPGRVRPVLAVARHPHHDQARVVGHQVLGRHPPLLEGARPEVLDDDVRGGDQPSGQVLAVLLPQVDGDRPLAPGHHRPPQRPAVGLLPTPLPHGVALARRLELDDVRAEVRQELTAERSGEQLAHLHHSEVGQGCGHGGPLGSEMAGVDQTVPPTESSS